MAQQIRGNGRRALPQDLTYYDVPALRKTSSLGTHYTTMPDHESIIEWYKSTGMRPLEKLTSKREASSPQALARIRNEYTVQEDGRVLFPFRGSSSSPQVIARRWLIAVSIAVETEVSRTVLSRRLELPRPMSRPEVES